MSASVPRALGTPTPLAAAPTQLLAAICLCSFAAVYLQVSLMRLVSVKFYLLLVFAMIGVALLGYGAAGSFLAARGAPDAPAAPRALARALVGFALTALPAFLVVNAIDVRTDWLFGSLRGLPVLLAIYALLTVPFFFAGLAMSSVFAAFPGDVNRLYFADLLGAGAGSAAAIATTPWLGGLPLLATAGGIAGLAAVLGYRAAGRSTMPALVSTLANLVAVLVLSSSHRWEVHISPDKHGPILAAAASQGRGLRTDFSAWSRFGRVDITEPFATLPPQFGGDVSPVFKDLRIEQRMLMLDGAAPAFLYHVDRPLTEMPFLAGTSQSPAYLLRSKPRVLVIGVGGATDLLIGLGLGAVHITAGELNPVNAHAVRTVFKDYLGDVISDPRVSLVVAEGRNFVARDTDQYDIIQLSGVDTGVAQGAWGLGTMPESYIYTTEAFTDLLARLAPGGVLSITRDVKFGWAERVAALARVALSTRGLDPAPRIAVIEGHLYHWGTLLVKQDAFTSAEVDTLTDFARRYQFTVDYNPLVPGNTRFDRVIRHGLGSDGVLDLRPATDDWPFLFMSLKWARILDVLGQQNNPFAHPVVFLIMSLFALTLVALGLIGWPLWRLRAAWRTTPGKITAATYFALLGAGFMLVEVALMQRFTVFLGNPALAVATVLAALLVSSGVGSQLARRWQERGRDVVGVAVAWIVLVQLGFASAALRGGLQALLWLPLAARLAICVVLVAIAGLPMGMPFPAGLARVAMRARAFVPWGWGINGMVSVVSSLASYFIGMIFGYTTMFYAGALIYAAALVASRRL